MRAVPNEKYRLYIYLSLMSTAMCLLVGRFEFLLLGTPFLVSLVLPLFSQEKPKYQVRCDLPAMTAFEGGEITVAVHIQAETSIPLLEVEHWIQGAKRSADNPVRLVTSIGAGEERLLHVKVRLPRRGTFRPGGLSCRGLDRAGLYWSPHLSEATSTLYVYPEITGVELPGSGYQIGAFTGRHLSKARGEGIELRGIREYERGDSIRHINWRVSNRWNTLHINEQHPERNFNVVLMIDTLRDVGYGDRTALNAAARGAGSLAAYFLRRKNPVGLIEYSGRIQGIAPVSDRGQIDRILQRLAGLRPSRSFVQQDVDTIPPGVLSANDLVILFTPLLDERSTAVLTDLFELGIHPAVIYLSPTLFVAPTSPKGSDLHQLAHRWWAVRQRDKVADLREVGFAIAEWDGVSAVEGPLWEALGERDRVLGSGSARRRVRWTGGFSPRS